MTPIQLAGLILIVIAIVVACIARWDIVRTNRQLDRMRMRIRDAHARRLPQSPQPPTNQSAEFNARFTRRALDYVIYDLTDPEQAAQYHRRLAQKARS